MAVMNRHRLNWLDWTALAITVIGALNWGLVGFFNYDLVRAIFSGNGSPTATITLFSNVIFAIVGLAGLYSIYSLYKVGQMQSRAMPAEERMRKAA